jgi:hypothetical protein
MAATDIILEHLDTVRDAFAPGGGTAAAWRRLRQTSPAVASAMTGGTFRVLAPALLRAAERLRPSAPPDAAPALLRTFEGWTVCRAADGYIRLHRRVGGRGRTVYIGRIWNEAKARERIAALTRF